MGKEETKNKNNRFINSRPFRLIVRQAKPILAVFLLASIALNIWQFIKYKKPEVLLPLQGVNINTNQSISQIEAYLGSINQSYMQDEQTLAKQADIPSWGCGPSSYAMAVILNKRFFDDKLPINASYESSEPYQIVERFSLHEQNNQIADHNWLEIYYKNQFLYVDPSIAQFGYINKIAYQEFNVSDPNISNELKSNYGIVDLRIGLLLNKAIDRVPAADNPYPGVAIDPNLIGYYTQIYDDRNDVEDHKIPAEWVTWVNFLVNKYS
jgi:hypothetical protein